MIVYCRVCNKSVNHAVERVNGELIATCSCGRFLKFADEDEVHFHNTKNVLGIDVRPKKPEKESHVETKVSLWRKIFGSK